MEGEVMHLEHIGYMVSDPVAVARWYCDQLNFRVFRQMSHSPWTHFLVDGSGRMMLEIYNNPKAQVPNYASLDPLVLHLAFAVDDVEQIRGQLLIAGAKAEGEISVTAAGDRLAMLRDPWGLAIQLAKRAKPF
jgi:glyoxylase I family protein